MRARRGRRSSPLARSWHVVIRAVLRTTASSRCRPRPPEGRPSIPVSSRNVAAGERVVDSSSSFASRRISRRPRAITDRAERRRFVYESLRAHAETAPGAASSSACAALGVRYRSHYLVNMLEVEGRRLGDRTSSRRGATSRRSRRTAARRSRGPSLGAAPRSETLLHGHERAEHREGPRARALGPRLHAARGSWSASRTPASSGTIRPCAATTAARTARRRTTTPGTTPSTIPRPATPAARTRPRPATTTGTAPATAGLAVGDDGPGNRIGVAPGATLIGCRNMDRGNGTPARYTECFEWFLAPTDAARPRTRGPDLGADVINNSWACPASEGCTDPNILETVVENVRAAGVAVVVRGGQRGTDSGAMPACFDCRPSRPRSTRPPSRSARRTLDDTIATFSSVGPGDARRLEPAEARSHGAGRQPADGRDVRRLCGLLHRAPRRRRRRSRARLRCSGRRFRASPETWTGRVQALEAGAVPRTAPGGRPAAASRETDVPNPVFGWGRLDVEGRVRARHRDRVEPVVRRAMIRNARRPDPPLSSPTEPVSAPPSAGYGSRDRISRLMAILAARRTSPPRARCSRSRSRPRRSRRLRRRHPLLRRSGPRSRASARERRPRPSSRSGSPTRSRATSSSASLPDALASAIEERKLAVLGRPHIEDLKWEPPGPIRFAARLDLKPAVDPGEYRGVPVEDSPVEPTEDGGRRRSSTASARRTPSSTRSRAGRRRPGDFAVADIAGSFVEILAPGPEPADLPGREDHARGRPCRLDARDQRGPARRGAGRDAPLPQDLRRRLPERRVQGKDRRLPGDARRAQGEEAARRSTTSSPGPSRRGTRSRRCARRCAARLRHEKEADRRRRFRRDDPRQPRRAARHPGAGGPRRVRDDVGAARLRAVPRAERRGPREGGLGEAPARRRGRAPRGESASTCCSTRSPSARGSRSRTRSSRRSSSARPPSGASSRRPCASRWRRRAGSRRSATRCAWPRPSTS